MLSELHATLPGSLASFQLHHSLCQRFHRCHPECKVPGATNGSATNQRSRLLPRVQDMRYHVTTQVGRLCKQHATENTTLGSPSRELTADNSGHYRGPLSPNMSPNIRGLFFFRTKQNPFTVSASGAAPNWQHRQRSDPRKKHDQSTVTFHACNRVAFTDAVVHEYVVPTVSFGNAGKEFHRPPIEEGCVSANAHLLSPTERCKHNSRINRCPR